MQTLEAELGNLKEKTGFKSELQGLNGEGKKLSSDVEGETKTRKEKLEEDEQKSKATKKSDQDDRELQGTIDANTEALGRHTPDVLGVTPDATL